MSDPDQQLAHFRADDETAFVLGNGPSLSDISLQALSPYATIGMNAAYRYWREIDWRPRYYACVDTVVGMSHKDEIAALIDEGRIERFLLRNNLVEALGVVARTARVVNFDAARESLPLLTVNPPTTGSHSALWAASMGYRKICVLGVDGRYKEIVDGAKRGDGIELEIVEAGDNPNYFFSNYQQPGDRYNVPNPRPDLHVNAWRRTAARLADHGIDVFNGNLKSTVRCLPFIDLSAFLEGDAQVTPADDTAEALAPDDSAAASGGSRARAFLAGFGAGLSAVVGAIALMLALWIAFTSPSAAVIALAFAGAGAFFAFAVGVLYMRFAILGNLAQQNAAISGLRARIADLERLSGYSRPRRND